MKTLLSTTLLFLMAVYTLNSCSSADSSIDQAGITELKTQVLTELKPLDKAFVALKAHVLDKQLFPVGAIDSSLKLNFETDFYAANGPMVQNADIYYTTEFQGKSASGVFIPYQHPYENTKNYVRHNTDLNQVTLKEQLKSLTQLNYVVVLDFKELILPKAISDAEFEMGLATVAYQLIDLRKQQVLKEGTFSITSEDHVEYRHYETADASKKTADMQGSLNLQYSVLIGEKLTEELKKVCNIENKVPFPVMR